MARRNELLITADQLLEQLKDSAHPKPIILDCRFNLADTDEGFRLYREGHIPGAFHAHLDHDLSGPILPGRTGRHPLPSPSALQATLRRWGISADTEVVVYDAGNAMMAGRAWWLCRWAGLRQVRVLDGGLPSWLNINGPVEIGEPPLPTEGSVRVICPDDWVIDADSLQRRLPEFSLLDARAEARYSGATEPMDKKAGHIPGAQCADFTANLDGSGRFKSSEALRQRFESIPEDASVVCYCGSGVTACHNVLALMLADHPRPLLYAGSWSDWINDDQRPVATGIEKEPLQ